MATHEQYYSSMPVSKTPGIFNRIKAASSRVLSSRNENRSSFSPDAASSISAYASTRPSLSQDRTAYMPQRRPNTTQPGPARHGEHQPSPKVSRSSGAQVADKQLQSPSMQHIVYQATPSYSAAPPRSQTALPSSTYKSTYLPTARVPTSLGLSHNYSYVQPQSSLNVLRRKPSIIGEYVSVSRATDREEDLADVAGASPASSPTQAPNQSSSDISQRRAQEYPTQGLRHAGRAVITPDSSRSFSRAAMTSSATPSSPSTYRHDTPSIFSHASRATSRTAYSPTFTAPYAESTWDMEFPVPPLPETLQKLPLGVTPATLFIPPELAHLAHHPVSKSSSPYVPTRDTFSPRPAEPVHVIPAGAHTLPRPAVKFSQSEGSASTPLTKPPTPLQAMDPALRSRVTLSDASRTSIEMARRPRNKDMLPGQDAAKCNSKTKDAPSRPSTSSATGPPRKSTDKPRPFRRPSIAPRHVERLSFQCQGLDEDRPVAMMYRSHASESNTQRKPKLQHAQNSRSYSFSRTSLKAKSSVESLKSTLSFAQRMFMKSKDSLSCIGPVDTSNFSAPKAEQAYATHTKDVRHSSALSRASSFRAGFTEPLLDATTISPSSRTSLERSRQSATISRLPTSVLAKEHAIEPLSHDTMAAHKVARKPVTKQSNTQRPVTASKVPSSLKDLPRLPNEKSTAGSRTVPANMSTIPQDVRDEFMRFSTMTSARNSSGSDTTADASTSKAPPLARLNSAESGRSSVLGSYALFPQPKVSPTVKKLSMSSGASPRTSLPGRDSAEISVARTTSIRAAVPQAVDSQQYDINLRLGALTASTAICGRVLFSPADVQIKTNVGEKILVMDGCGEDWSLYCAATQSNADVFNLPLVESHSTTRDELTTLRGLTNHKEVPSCNLAAQLPLPSNHFSVVVLRFPPVMDEALLRNIICELKRVLRPGGYIELITIDLDLQKMGSDTRRAVRDHKIKLHTTNNNLSLDALKPASDNVQRLLAHRGFEHMKSGVVFINAASDRTESIDRSWLSKHDPSRQQSESGTTYSAAEVSQWWYNKCYENHDTSTSIWQDKLILRECARLQSAFKVQICYAQKPAIVKRRNASV